MEFSLYNLCEYDLQLDSLIENATGDNLELLQKAQEQLKLQIASKIENIVHYRNTLSQTINNYREEEKRIADKRHKLEKRQEYLDNMIQQYMVNNDKKKMEVGTFTLSVVKNPYKVIIKHEELIPEDLCDVSITPNKTKIKEAMTDGQLKSDDIVIAELIQTETLRIK